MMALVAVDKSQEGQQEALSGLGGTAAIWMRPFRPNRMVSLVKT